MTSRSFPAIPLLVVCLLAAARRVPSNRSRPSATGHRLPAAPACRAPAGAQPRRLPCPRPPRARAVRRRRHREGVELHARRSDQFLPRLDVYFPEGRSRPAGQPPDQQGLLRGPGQVQLRQRRHHRPSCATATTATSGRPSSPSSTPSSSTTSTRTCRSDFDRVRGTLLLMQWPHSYHQRTFFLAELDRISSNKEERGSNFLVRRDSQHLRPPGLPVRHAGRGALERHRRRDPGAHRAAVHGLPRVRPRRLRRSPAPLTYGFAFGLGDFDYLKLESEAAEAVRRQRADLPGRPAARRAPSLRRPSATRGRCRPSRSRARPPRHPARSRLPARRPREPQGRERDRTRGTDELYTTWEYFFPWFLDARATVSAPGVAELVLDPLHGSRYDWLRQ